MDRTCTHAGLPDSVRYHRHPDQQQRGDGLVALLVNHLGKHAGCRSHTHDVPSSIHQVHQALQDALFAILRAPIHRRYLQTACKEDSGDHMWNHQT